LAKTLSCPQDVLLASACKVPVSDRLPLRLRSSHAFARWQGRRSIERGHHHCGSDGQLADAHSSRTCEKGNISG